jgi:site-specific DNA-cytosine methylase
MIQRDRKKLKAIELFAGAGGMALELHMFEVM